MRYLLTFVFVLMAGVAGAQTWDLWPKPVPPKNTPSPAPVEVAPPPPPEQPVSCLPCCCVTYIPEAKPDVKLSTVIVEPVIVPPKRVKIKKKIKPKISARTIKVPAVGERISCADARRGVGLPCFLIRANAHVYEAYTPEQKRQAQACLTREEQEAIIACFR